MCGILGLFGAQEKDSRAAMGLLQARGHDGAGWAGSDDVAHAPDVERLAIGGEGLGHVLHSIVGHHAQPLAHEGVLVANCEVYNWEELSRAHGLGAKNDADALCLLLDRCDLSEGSVRSLLGELDGIFAFAYRRGDTLIVARDLLGVKPLWYSHQGGFGFASERKALLAAGFSDVADLNPRVVLCYDLASGSLARWRRPFFSKEEPSTDGEESLAARLKELLGAAVRRRIPAEDVKVGVLFSGGLDSTLLAKICLDEGLDVTCYTAHVDNPRGKEAHDLVAARGAARRYGFDHRVISVSEEEVPALAREVSELIEEPNAVKVGVGMPFLAATRAAKEDGCRVLFSGLGAEELFAGYQRHRDAADVNDECLAGLSWMYERDLYRDDVITMREGLELRVPFLDLSLVRFSLAVPSSLKLKDGVEKYLLRRAALLWGLEEEDAFRPKKAAQYGSGFDGALERAARAQGKNRAGFLRSLLPVPNRRLGVLCSGGKDSWYAAQVMRRLNYDLAVCLTMRSDNPDSYMFHTPAIDLVRLQSEAAGLPLLEQSTLGEKESELDDLRELLRRAKEEYGIEGVVTGALFSQYQRERVERLCEELSLKPFAPLWHLDQESELRELLREGFVITMSSIAGEGLSEQWLGREVGEEEVEALVALKRRIGFHVAGEGGEYESLVLDCPLFSKRLVVEGEAVMENRITGRLNIKGAHLE